MTESRLQKIAILGGGIGGLVTAFELTSQPGWRERFDITLHQLGWRLGGKCASSRGVNGRIEEHGIHGFLGSYYNALPLMAACYAELGRQPGQPLATFEEAFLPENFVLMWEWRDNAFKRWTQVFKLNDRSPSDGAQFVPFEKKLAALIEFLEDLLETHHPKLGVESAAVDHARGMLAEATASLASGLEVGPDHPLLDILERGWGWLSALILHFIEGSDELRRTFIVVDYLFTLIRGTLRDNIAANGFDSIDDQDWCAWLLSHGANPLTVASPMAMTNLNITYQYPNGDTSLPPAMAAGACLHWTLRAFNYLHASIWQFAAGTGETVIAPLYLVLRARGVKFEFFHKVEALRLSADGQSISAVEIAVQANLKDAAKPYEPLIEVKDLPCWPAEPLFDQLIEGEALRAAAIDLESYWTPWTPVGRATLTAGVDYDRLVFAISIGAVPHLCVDLLAARPAWRDMVSAVPALLTQTMQIWLSKDIYQLGWDIPLTGSDTVISATYLNPFDGQAEFRHLLPLEDWPPEFQPQSLWYFCGLMSEPETVPPFTDHDYPARQRARVRHQAIQYLQASVGPLLPNATTNVSNPPGDPVGLDFNLLVDTRPSPTPGGSAAIGMKRFESQFWRANIDPTERYVATPPGSTRYRLKAWETGFTNLVIAGDWIYTGLNVGSLEGTVMSGKLASYALSGAPTLDTIIGYPTPPAPAEGSA